MSRIRITMTTDTHRPPPAGGRLEPVRQKSILEGVAATSFATPNALARDVLAAMGRQR